jgi:hypothetical protein
LTKHCPFSSTTHGIIGLTKKHGDFGMMKHGVFGLTKHDLLVQGLLKFESVVTALVQGLLYSEYVVNVLAHGSAAGTTLNGGFLLFLLFFLLSERFCFLYTFRLPLDRRWPGIENDTDRYSSQLT